MNEEDVHCGGCGRAWSVAARGGALLVLSGIPCPLCGGRLRLSGERSRVAAHRREAPRRPFARRRPGRRRGRR